MRIGHGYDAHRFAAGERLVLGGVEIPHDKGLAAHSDGDVALHALCDALIGAAGSGDIGKHFPDNDPRYENIDSRILLRRVIETLGGDGFRVGNADVTIIAEEPRLSTYVAQMRSNIAADLGIDAARVNVKATTTEKMGFVGRAEGIAAHAVVLLEE
ncbi:MAG: 2-C-methyl-D-erythritol 2,4-cyclodiphosphate synthase [Gammaproteobacteria bacterium]|jgi:2-C-methyl-D-erythritol 2,4-cyclodiphosphate synthase|nr:2-C-methyl-D-erythritol 2,4-cyclodiphosphate synthase [Gammaproteobacteria bacterium]